MQLKKLRNTKEKSTVKKSQLSISNSTSLMKLLNLSESQLPLFKMKATIASHRVVPVKSKTHQEHFAQCSVVEAVGDSPALHSENISPTCNFPAANTHIFLAAGPDLLLKKWDQLARE